MNYTGPIIAITSKMEPQFSIDLAVKRDFLDNRISLTARVTDLLNTLKNSYTAWGDNFYAKTGAKRKHGLSISASHTTSAPNQRKQNRMGT